jgi:lipopolysaccharide transport system ATP-binding protein
MSEVAIRVEGLSKLYHIGTLQRYKTLRDTLTDALNAPFRIGASFLKSRPPADAGRPSNNSIWALKDVSFEVKQGEVVGIIGRNGAGKSTLLKVLSRIMEPTEGYATIQGRVGSLLELGVGFHPELTGRENVYLNGAILAMSKAEISRKFDEIVTFAGLEKFIDTMVKYYSSGMYVRLAFAVAAHMEPKVLLVDEVLSVGDAEFQNKCIGTLEKVGRVGRTVLFVSHNMESIMRLCTRSIWLHDGQVKEIGETKKVVNDYLAFGSQRAEVAWELHNAPGHSSVIVEAIRVVDRKGESKAAYMISEPVNLQMDFRVLLPDGTFTTSVHVFRDGGGAFTTVDHRQFKEGWNRMTCEIPAHLLNDGYHQVSFHMSFNGFNIINTEDIHFTVTDDGSARGDYTGAYLGAVRPDLPWTHQCLETRASLGNPRSG